MRLGNYRSRTNYAVKVGDSEHGGIYTPPICFEDIQKLMKVLLEWLNSESVRSLSVLYTAPLLHLLLKKYTLSPMGMAESAEFWKQCNYV